MQTVDKESKSTSNVQEKWKKNLANINVWLKKSRDWAATVVLSEVKTWSKKSKDGNK